MHADWINLWKILDEEIQLYQMNHSKTLDSKGIANFLSRLLYSKWNFPFYTFNIVIGKDEGKMWVWHYDAVGSFEKSQFEAAGNGTGMMVSHMRQIF